MVFLFLHRREGQISTSGPYPRRRRTLSAPSDTPLITLFAHGELRQECQAKKGLDRAFPSSIS